MKQYLAVLLASLCICSPAAAASLSDGELDSIHAGYLSADGIEFSLGAVVKSYVDGNMILTSTMSMTQNGIATTQQLGPEAQTLDATTATGLGLNPASAANGAMVTQPDGMVTAFVQNLTGNQIANVLANTASGLAITQNTNVTIAVPNLQALQQGIGLQGMSSGLQSAVGLALRSSAHN